MNPDSIQRQIDRLKHDADLARRLHLAEVIAHRRARQHLKDSQEALSFVQQVAQMVEQQAHAKIAGVVTTCLKTVFGEDSYEFRLRFERKRNKTEAHPILLKGGHEVEDPVNEDSGGAVQIAAFALRLSCLMMAVPRLRKLLVLDEPFPHVSAQYRPAVRSLLQQLSRKFGIQFIIVTHEEQYMTGKVIKL